jgi:hypothetical protein
MGYDVHVTRRKSWSDIGGPAITEREWLAQVGDDPDLASLVWNEGNLDAKNPDERLVPKLVSVAAAMGATVQGDDGESYNSRTRLAAGRCMNSMERTVSSSTTSPIRVRHH